MQAPATPPRSQPASGSYDDLLLFEEAPTMQSAVDLRELYALQSAPTLRAALGVPCPAMPGLAPAPPAAQLSTAPTRPATVTLADLAAMLQRNVAGPRKPMGGADHHAGPHAAELPAAMESSAPPSTASTPTHLRERQLRGSSSGGCEAWGSGPMSFDAVAEPSGAPLELQQQPQSCACEVPPSAPSNEPLGPGGRWWLDPDQTKLFPSPFASSKFPTGGWPIYLMKYVVPAPWAPAPGGAAGAPGMGLGLKVTVPKGEKPRRSMGKGFIAMLCRKSKTSSS